MAEQKKRRKRKKKQKPEEFDITSTSEDLLAPESKDEKRGEVGPLGNPDFVPFGSPAHSALLGFTGDGELDTIFDLNTVPERVADRFVEQRRNWLNGGKPTIPPGCPPRWSPEQVAEVGEVN